VNQPYPDHDHRPPANSHGCPHCLEEATTRIAELEARVSELKLEYAELKELIDYPYFWGK